jgi:hypothetical protein
MTDRLGGRPASLCSNPLLIGKVISTEPRVKTSRQSCYDVGSNPLLIGKVISTSTLAGNWLRAEYAACSNPLLIGKVISTPAHVGTQPTGW